MVVVGEPLGGFEWHLVGWCGYLSALLVPIVWGRGVGVQSLWFRIVMFMFLGVSLVAIRAQCMASIVVW